jgi:hypothetical protein
LERANYMKALVHFTSKDELHRAMHRREPRGS